MKFLFTLMPAFGHFHAMVRLAEALRDHGHEVAFATGPALGPAIRSAGFTHFPCGFDFDTSAPELRAVLPAWAGLGGKLPADPTEQLRGFIQGFAPRMATDVLVLMNTWQPDLVIRDPVEFGGYIAAECAGLPHATIMWAFYIDARLACPADLFALRQMYGLPADPHLSTLDRYLVLDFLPAAWQFPTWPPPPVTHRFCAPPFDRNGAGGLPDWLQSLPQRPIVYATMGTTFAEPPPVYQAILDALGGEDVNLVMTVGRSIDPARFRLPGPNLKVAQYIPQTQLLPACAAIIFHGAFNTLLSAIWHGLPMVLIPQLAGDQVPAALRCAEVGLGVVLEGHPPAAESIRTAVKTVLAQPGYRARAQQFQREVQSLPPLAEAVKRLEILARTGEPQLTLASPLPEGVTGPR